jgi:hypothetical protein
MVVSVILVNMGVIPGQWEMVMAMVPDRRNMEIMPIEAISNINRIESAGNTGNMSMKIGAMVNIVGMIMIDKRLSVFSNFINR